MTASYSVLLVLALFAGQSLAITGIFSNGFGITRYTCFGTEVANRDDDDVESEFDICVAGILTGFVLLVGLYPLYLSKSNRRGSFN